VAFDQKKIIVPHQLFSLVSQFPLCHLLCTLHISSPTLYFFVPYFEAIGTNSGTTQQQSAAAVHINNNNSNNGKTATSMSVN
jgi:hypothetical protein